MVASRSCCMLVIRVLGQFGVELDGCSVELSSRPAQSLLAYLALHAGVPHRRERLAGLFWIESSEANARNNLRQALWRIRKAIDTRHPSRTFIRADDLIVTFDSTADYWLDAAALVRQITPDAPLERLIETLGLYRAELLPGFYEDWVDLERERLQAVFDGGMQILLARLLDAGRWTEAIDQAERWIAQGRIPEPAYRVLMVANWGKGDIAAVAAAFQRCATALQRELALKPSDQTQALYTQLTSTPASALVAASILARLDVADTAYGLRIQAALIDKTPITELCPYKGLRTFDTSDAALFVGREQLTADLAARLLVADAQHGRFLAVIGASGSGKSSLLRAGLIPALCADSAPAEYAQSSIAGGYATALLCTPTGRPLESLAATVCGMTEHAALLEHALSTDAGMLHLALRAAWPVATIQPQVLLVVDQFEELFTLCEDVEARGMFVANLLTAAQQESAAIVIALRADFYAHCGHYPGLRAALERCQVYIGPMSRDELRCAIEEPAKRVGYELEPGLVELLLRDVGVRGQGQAEPGALPLLSHALLETWRRRRGRLLTLRGYAEAGGVQDAIAQTAERVLSQLTTAQQGMARMIFVQLTELGNATQDTRRRVAVAAFQRQPETASAVMDVLAILVNARLITISSEIAVDDQHGADVRAAAYVELAHEALIRAWPTLRSWLDEDRAATQMMRQLSAAAQTWERLERDPGELYRGARLAQALEWAERNGQMLTAQEQVFLAESQAAALRAQAEQQAQRQRELEAAQRIAEVEQQRAKLQARAARRLGVLAIVLAALFLTSTAASFLAVQQSRRATQEATRAAAVARLATARELAAASRAQRDVDPERSILLALEAIFATYAVDGVALPEAVNALHAAVQSSHLLRTLVGHSAHIRSVAISADGTQLVSAGDDNMARVWDAVSGRELRTLAGHGKFIAAIALSPDEQRLATASDDHTVRIWDMASGEQVLEILHPVWINDIAYSPDGNRLATVYDESQLLIWDTHTGKLLLSLQQPVDAPYPPEANGIAFSPNGRDVAMVSRGNLITVWDLIAKRARFSLRDAPAALSDVAYSPDGRNLIVVGDQGTAIVRDALSGHVLMQLRGHAGALHSVAYSPDGRRVATAGADGTALVWDAATGALLLRLAGHVGPVRSVAFSPDGRQLLSGGDDRTLRIWDLGPGHEHYTLHSHAQGLNGFALSADQRLLATTGDDKRARLWEAETGRLLKTLPEGGTDARWPNPDLFDYDRYDIVLSPDGKFVATIGSDGSARIWETASGREVFDLDAHQDRVWDVAFNPDGTLLATASADGTAKVWTTSKGALRWSLANHLEPITAVAFSPDGTVLATGSADKTAKIWSLATGEELHTLVGHTDSIFELEFSPDGTRLLTASRGYDLPDRDTTVRIWDVVEGTQLLVLQSHSAQIWSAAYHPDGTSVATAGADGIVIVWDALTGQQRHVLRGHSAAVNDVAFSPDGTQLATAGDDGTARLWDVVAGQERLAIQSASAGLIGVAFVAHGRHLLTFGTDGAIRAYVLPIEELIPLAQSRLTRRMSAEECAQYLRRSACP
jgi:WD40 repeat protein/DNA-binding SARP family transcriptional activator